MLLTLRWTDNDPGVQKMHIVKVIPDAVLPAGVHERMDTLALPKSLASPRSRAYHLPPSASPRRTPPPWVKRISDFLGTSPAVRSWNATSLFGADARDAVALRRHRAKVHFLERLAHILLVQESRGTAVDLAKLHDLPPGGGCHGTFAPSGTSGGTMILISPLILAHYPERSFESVVFGRIAIARMRGLHTSPLDICAVHFVASPSVARRQQFPRLANALAPLGDSCTILAGGHIFCAPGEGRLDLSEGSLLLDVSAEPEASGTIFPE